MKLVPNEGRVIVEPIASQTITPGGIVLPDAAQEKSGRGKVVAVGPGRTLEMGMRADVFVNVGDEILFSIYGGTDIEFGGTAYKVLNQLDIQAKVIE